MRRSRSRALVRTVYSASVASDVVSPVVGLEYVVWKSTTSNRRRVTRQSMRGKTIVWSEWRNWGIVMRRKSIQW